MKKIFFVPGSWMCRFLPAIGLLFFPFASRPQNGMSFNLDTCLKLAAENYPLAKQKGYLQAIGENDIKGINGAWLPQLNVNSRITEYSEVVNFSFPGFPALNFPNDQENFGLTLNQTIYDGGVTAQQKKVQIANTETEIQKTEVELYKVKDRIVQLYGNILLAKENVKVLESYREDIKGRKEKMSSSVRNGAMLQSNLDVLEAEMLKTQQKTIEAESNLKVLCQVLALFTGKQVDETAAFADISVSVTGKNENGNRPEWKLFDLQKNLMSEKLKLSNRKTLPHLSLFGDGAYGRPGYNFLDQNFRLYGLVGLSLTWNISSIYNLSYERRNLAITQKMMDGQRELFQLTLNAVTTQQSGEIEKLKQMTEMDQSIVEKRKSVSKTAASQLDNGAITSSDYVTELNAEKQAVLNQRMHQIQLGIAIRSYGITTGN